MLRTAPQKPREYQGSPANGGFSLHNRMWRCRRLDSGAACFLLNCSNQDRGQRTYQYDLLCLQENLTLVDRGGLLETLPV